MNYNINVIECRFGLADVRSPYLDGAWLKLRKNISKD